MLRRLYAEQPESFAFTPENLDWAQSVIAKYPEGRQASAVILLLWRAQEQEGWVTKPAIEYVASLLGMAYIRVLEVATFYFMFQLQPVGKTAHLQICGTTSCMICGAEELMEVCRRKIAPHPFQLSEDGLLSWEEVECLGACSNAPMAQIGKDYYEDLTPDRLARMIDAFRAGEVPVPGPQNGRWACEPRGGLTSLADTPWVEEANASVALARANNDTIARITGAPLPASAWERGGAPLAMTRPEPAPVADAARDRDVEGTKPRGLIAEQDGRGEGPEAQDPKPLGLILPREGGPADLERLGGVAPARAGAPQPTDRGEDE